MSKLLKKEMKESESMKEYCEECKKYVGQSRMEHHRQTKTHKLFEERYNKSCKKNDTVTMVSDSDSESSADSDDNYEINQRYHAQQLLNKNNNDNSDSEDEKPIRKRQVIKHPFNDSDSDSEDEKPVRKNIISRPIDNEPTKNIQIRQFNNTVRVIRNGKVETDTNGNAERFATELINGIMHNNLDVNKLLKKYGYM
ncbi:hypothetical protein BMW23_0912 [Bodo saltans virus]|jgi:hypothetical protein|uniref:Uncharacterized protein n=1 Tax=Bodo saltans virus TaxID=2024608 RepID=A0A2H4UVQ7_9VIRU|nr:hypothetical protein QJ851_gp0894 [Bodo saltans virus]ATZ80957.1 hypothetical protein BMW23_0912 [Bodo saltans virus]